MRTVSYSAAWLLSGLLATSALAQEVQVKTVVTNLYNPSGLAIQPETGDVFIADSGNGRVLSYHDNPRSIAVRITGFFPPPDSKPDVYGKGPMYDIGPLGLLFLNKNSLAIGDGGLKDGQELMHFITLPETGEITADKAKTAGPIAAGEQSAMGEGNFYALASNGKSVFITSNGDDTKGWVLKVDVSGAEPGKLEPFIATKVATEVDAPVGITMTSDGKIVVGQMGEVNVPKDSLYTVYDVEGKLQTKATTGLFDIAGLAYHPKSGKLYAVDFAWMDSKEGGLFRLDVKTEGDQTTVTPTKITALDKPTALAFAPDGTLYVTVFGTAEEGATKKPGKLLKITGDL